ncbi:unnamed protein product, partial [Brenthis ino]
MNILCFILWTVYFTITKGIATTSEASLDWIRDRSVHETLGVEDAVYCKLEGPNGVVYHDGFGRCQLSIDKVMLEHAGVWKMNVGLSGRLLTEDSEFTVKVVEAVSVSKPMVTTSVEENRPTISLTCFIPNSDSISSCKFRHPSGRIFLVNKGVEEDDNQGNIKGNLSDHSCSILITDPVVKDMGFWRCAVKTESDVLYGFVKVLTPWIIRDPEVAASIITEPTLKATRNVVASLAGDNITMSCSVQSAIRYCYFRASNGTMFSVQSAESQDQATYFGSGFDAGECGIRFSGLAANDSGAWSCHVGFLNAIIPEQRATINITIHDPMVADGSFRDCRLTIEAQVYENRTLDYCRFVRNDGLGFTSENIPDSYINLSLRSSGRCGLAIDNPRDVELHPWTVVAKITGQALEISRVIPRTRVPSIIIFWPSPSAWIVLTSLSLTFIIICIVLGSKNNRDWTYNRASVIRNSFIRKNVAQQQQNTEKDTAPSA